ncbi:ubiquinol-cytochrome c reductase iron-sulfur subunit [Calothrix sp. PCC 6303]|uniref:QcrA and Rieske domain-containing protein n=1 Tax=Calothrix sp. PCC 6303 TaxID=1170562 RepID=UPI0002A023F7|nr:ubiquinol-cytochrome c reductase iron-sulfur subunit [Calothrix sp. PCC 6303]AFY99584.1 Rieske (2Fe-2S) iron-sulfur domain protein [Calothrix sp. PCC 6303]
MNRREFFGWFSVSAIASSLPLAIAACSPQTTEPKSVDASPRPDGFKSLGKVSDLDQKGLISTPTVIVIRNPSNQDSLIAVNSKCTHQGCAVAWEQTQKSFVCPCHESKFAADGKVLAGPAQKPLQTYTAKIEDGNVLVSVS